MFTVFEILLYLS